MSREIRLRRIPTATERERRRAAWGVVAFLVGVAFIVSKAGGLW